MAHLVFSKFLEHPLIVPYTLLSTSKHKIPRRKLPIWFFFRGNPHDRCAGSHLYCDDHGEEHSPEEGGLGCCPAAGISVFRVQV